MRFGPSDTLVGVRPAPRPFLVSATQPSRGWVAASTRADLRRIRRSAASTLRSFSRRSLTPGPSCVFLTPASPAFDSLSGCRRLRHGHTDSQVSTATAISSTKEVTNGMDETRTQTAEGGTDMTEQYVGTERGADRQPHTAPGQLRAGLVLDDDGHLSRREVGRAGVSAAARRQRHRHALPHRGLHGRRGDNRAGGAHRASDLDGVRAGERRGGQCP